MTSFPTYRDPRKVEGVERDTDVLIVIPIIVVIMAQYLLLVKWINDKINAMLEKLESWSGNPQQGTGSNLRLCSLFFRMTREDHYS
jgi:hypothetical protein